MIHPSDELFEIIAETTSNDLGPRLGRLRFARERTSIETPHYIGVTSRGVIPHISPDTFTRDTNLVGAYIGLEDFIERAPHAVPPLYHFHSRDGSSPLRRFIALTDRAICVLGVRRTPPVLAPAANPNTNTTVSVSTAVGFRPLRAEDYAEAVEALRPDIIIGIGDIPFGRALGSKRIEKAVDRTIDWMKGHFAWRETSQQTSQAKLFAPLLPVSCAQQQYYIEQLTDAPVGEISGLAVYSLDSLDDLPAPLEQLPRLAFTMPETPHEVLRQIEMGIDLFTVPFITSATDAGIALSFEFRTWTLSPTPTRNGTNCPDALGIDMWSPVHAIDLSPLVAECTCYTCTDHHRAYIQHLLHAKEMTGWLLLQIHNHHIMDLFFAAVRKSIAAGTFAEGVQDFVRGYESKLPEKTGLGPRVRGYERRSAKPGEVKQNSAPWSALEESLTGIVDSATPSPGEKASTAHLGV